MINGYLTINIFRRGRFTFPLKELEGVIPIYCPTWYHPTTSQPTKAAVHIERTPLNTVSPLRAAYLIGCSTPFRAISTTQILTYRGCSSHRTHSPQYSKPPLGSLSHWLFYSLQGNRIQQYSSRRHRPILLQRSTFLWRKCELITFLAWM